MLLIFLSVNRFGVKSSSGISGKESSASVDADIIDVEPELFCGKGVLRVIPALFSHFCNLLLVRRRFTFSSSSFATFAFAFEIPRFTLFFALFRLKLKSTTRG